MILLFISIEGGKQMMSNPMARIFKKLTTVYQRLLPNGKWEVALQATRHQKEIFNAIESHTFLPSSHFALKMVQKIGKLVNSLTGKSQGLKEVPEKYIPPAPCLDWEKPPPFA
jgi:hypothetical protein